MVQAGRTARCRLARNGKVKDVTELQSKGAERAVVTLKSLIQEAHEVQMDAKGAEQYAAATPYRRQPNCELSSAEFCNALKRGQDPTVSRFGRLG